MLMLQATALKKKTENAVGSEPVVPEVRHPEAHGRTGWTVGGGSGCGRPGAQGWHLTPSQGSEGTLPHKHVHFDGPHSW